LRHTSAGLPPRSPATSPAQYVAISECGLRAVSVRCPACWSRWPGGMPSGSCGPRALPESGTGWQLTPQEPNGLGRSFAPAFRSATDWSRLNRTRANCQARLRNRRSQERILAGALRSRAGYRSWSGIGVDSRILPRPRLDPRQPAVPVSRCSAVAAQGRDLASFRAHGRGRRGAASRNGGAKRKRPFETKHDPSRVTLPPWATRSSFGA
jgi:hypothetical protein